MALYTCKLGAADGSIQLRELEALDEQQLRTTLEEQGYYIFELKKRSFQFFFDKGLKSRRFDNREMLLFNQELLVLIKSGMPILQVLDAILEKRKDGSRLSALLEQIREDVKGGAALSTAMERHGSAFPQLYLASIRAGERTGDIPNTIRRYIIFLKKAELVRKKVIASLFYPVILVVVALMAITMLLLYVVPTFSRVYSDAGSQLPFLTSLLISFTSFLRQTILIWIIAIIGLSAWYKSWVKTDSGRFRADRIKLQLPILGEVFFRYSVSGFCRTLATLLGSGIPIVESLKMSVGTLNNRHIERRLIEAVKQVEEGTPLATALEKGHIMPPLALRMLGVGEATGALEEMLGDISDYLEDEVEERMHLLTTAIEPAIMVVMGLVIGFIIIAMYLPVFKIAGTVG